MQNEMTDGSGVNIILSRRFGVQGAPSPNVASEVFPIIDPFRDELLYLQNEAICGGAGFDAAVAGQFSSISLVNPPGGSGALCVVEKIGILNADPANAKVFNVTFANLQVWGGGLTNGIRLDSRYPVSAQGTVGKIGDFTGAAGGNVFKTIIVPANNSVEFEGPWICGPGSFLGVRGGAVNEQVWAYFRWTERTATKGELLGAVTF